MVTNVPHLFTLNPIASDIVKKIAKGRKSKQVSSAIIWYYKKKPEVKELVEANAQLMERYNLAMIELTELRDILEARGLKRSWFKFW
jgi:hypothetical protein